MTQRQAGLQSTNVAPPKQAAGLGRRGGWGRVLDLRGRGRARLAHRVRSMHREVID